MSDFSNVPSIEDFGDYTPIHDEVVASPAYPMSPRMEDSPFWHQIALYQDPLDYSEYAFAELKEEGVPWVNTSYQNYLEGDEEASFSMDHVLDESVDKEAMQAYLQQDEWRIQTVKDLERYLEKLHQKRALDAKWRAAGQAELNDYSDGNWLSQTMDEMMRYLQTNPASLDITWFLMEYINYWWNIHPMIGESIVQPIIYHLVEQNPGLSPQQAIWFTQFFNVIWDPQHFLYWPNQPLWRIPYYLNQLADQLDIG